MAMDLKFVRDDLYRKLNIEQPGNAPLYIRQDVVQAINQGFQTMQLSGGDYFTEETLTVAITAGQANYTLTQDLQRIVGPVRLQGGPILRPLRTRTEYDAFNLLYDGGDDMDLPTGEPRAYFSDAERFAGDDNVGITLKLVPVPVTNATLLLQVVKECPVYEADDFCDEPTPVPPCPHQYVELLLLPLARFYVTRSHWFTNEKLLPLLEADFQRAMVFMGLADPASNPIRKTAPPVETAA